MSQTFAQYLINSILPTEYHINKPMDKDLLSNILTSLAKKYPDKFDDIVTRLKALGDKLSTYEVLTMGIDEISTPNKKKRDEIIIKYKTLVANEHNEEARISLLEKLQNELKENDLAGTTDDASTMVRCSLTGKKNQLMKLRTSPGVVKASDGSIDAEIFPKGYAEGVDPVHFWLGAAESRANLVQGQVSTSAPGELGKVISNVLNGAVVSCTNCGTTQGIFLGTKDEDVIGRYLAGSAGKYPAGTKIDADKQQELIRAGVLNLNVRSPQTCQAKDGTVCSMCMGSRMSTDKDYGIGDNAGLITAGVMAEPLTQMTLSAKHSTALAKANHGLTGEKGFRKFVESPEVYPNRKILCEVYGVVYQIKIAPQGGHIITIRQTKVVPDRYIVNAMKNKDLKNHWDYFIPVQLKVLDEIEKGTEVYPGMELSTGNDNLKDVARLRNLGAARSASAQGMYDIYKNTGSKMARVHFELLARNANPYVTIEKAPASFSIAPGEVVEYNAFVSELKKLPSSTKTPQQAIGSVLAEGVLDQTAGTEVTAMLANYLTKKGVSNVKVTTGIEVSPATTPMTRVVNTSQDWISGMNHRYIKNQLKDAATYGKKSNIHGYKPITAYAYGAEMGYGKDGKY